MPKLSVFTKLGHLRLTSVPSHGELLYTAKVNGLGDQFAATEGSRMDALCYAQAMGEARVRYKLDRAFNQTLPTRLVDCLEKREAEFGVVPGLHDNVQARRATLAARYLLPQGNNYNNVRNALASSLGSAFVNYRITTTSEMIATPTNINDQPMSLRVAGVARLLARATDFVGAAGAATVKYTPIEPAGASIEAGDSLVVEPEVTGICERVTVSSASPLKTVALTGAAAVGSSTVGYSFSAELPPVVVGDVLTFGNPSPESVTVTAATFTGGSTGTLTATFGFAHASGDTATTTPEFTATFANPHSAGCLLTTMPFPSWQSTKRRAIIVLTAAAALDPDSRRKVNDLMKRMAREVSTWNIVPVSSTGHTGAFSIGHSYLDAATFGDVTY
jgi:hypothetical protein